MFARILEIRPLTANVVVVPEGIMVHVMCRLGVRTPENELVQTITLLSLTSPTSGIELFLMCKPLQGLLLKTSKSPRPVSLQSSPCPLRSTAALLGPRKPGTAQTNPVLGPLVTISLRVLTPTLLVLTGMFVSP